MDLITNIVVLSGFAGIIWKTLEALLKTTIWAIKWFQRARDAILYTEEKMKEEETRKSKQP